MSFHLEALLNQTGLSESELARQAGTSVNFLHQLRDGNTELDDKSEVFENLCDITDMSPKKFKNNFMNIGGSLTRALTPEDTWNKARMFKKNLTEYFRENISGISQPPVREELEYLEKCISSLRKPRITFAGWSDTGKSTLINALIGSEKMPAKWTPTTSIVVCLCHTEDRPAFLTENVYIFRQCDDRHWMERLLSDEKYFEEFVIANGDYNLLETYGIHQNETSQTASAFCAVAFIDSPLLKVCDILDVPGLGATEKDDAAHQYILQNETDVLIYLSRSNGFLQAAEIGALHACVKNLRCVERKGENDLLPLQNLFVVASQAGAVNNASELDMILTERCRVFCEPLHELSRTNSTHSALPVRTAVTGYVYTERDFRRRFFTFEKENELHCEKFNSELTRTAELLALVFYREFLQRLDEINKLSQGILIQKINDYGAIIETQESYVRQLQKTKEKEAQRKSKQAFKDEMIRLKINLLHIACADQIRQHYNSYMDETALINLIHEKGINNKKQEKEDFAATVNEVLISMVHSVIAENTKEYASVMKKYYSEYAQSFETDSVSVDGKVKVGHNNDVADGILAFVGGGVAGALLPVIIVEDLLFFGVFGPVGVALAAGVLAVMGVMDMFNWDKKLAKSIVKTYRKNNALDKFLAQNEQHWNKVLSDFDNTSNQIETKWREHLSELDRLAHTENLDEVRNLLTLAEKGLHFFENLPKS